MTETDQITQYQRLIGVHFLDPELLRRALTHRSFVNEVEDDVLDNERLEFLGDAIIDLIVAEMLFRRFPESTEGELTQLRAALVRAESLAILANNIRLGEYLIMGKGEENSGGRRRLNNLCRGYEALIGGLYLDRGMEAVRDFLIPPLNDLLAYVLENDLHKDARSMLQELSQAELRVTPVYQLKDILGPDHEREFLIAAMIAGVKVGEGTGTSKRAAAQSAARTALKRVEQHGWSPGIIQAVEAYHEKMALEAEQQEEAAADSDEMRKHIQLTEAELLENGDENDA